MIKFTDEQKRELLTEYKGLLDEESLHINELKETNPEYENIKVEDTRKLLEEVDNDLSRFNDEQWASIFACSLLCSNFDNENPNNNWSWMSLIGVALLFGCNPPLPNFDKLKEKE